MNKRSHKTAIVTLCLLVILLGGFLAFDVHNISKQNKETSELLNSVNERADQKILAQEIRQFQNREKDNIAAFNESVITEDRIVTVFESVEKAGRQLNLDIKIEVDDKRDTTDTNPKQLGLSIEAAGSWGSNITFLHALENLPYRLEISEARITKNEGVWRSTFKITLPSFKN